MPHPQVAIIAALVAVSVALAGPKVRRMTASDALDARAKGVEVTFLDTRDSNGEWSIPGSVHVPLDRIDEWAATAKRDALVVAYCT